jgi:hypothetical protein
MYKLANTNVVVYRGRFCWCGNTYVYSVVYIAIRVALGPVKSSRYENPMTYMCDVSCVAVRRML